MVTLFHWDLPQSLQDAYGGFNSSSIVDDFVYYADAVFGQLGPLVKTWITFNEPLVTCDLGFKAGEGVARPGHLLWPVHLGPYHAGALGHHGALLGINKAVSMDVLSFFFCN